MGKHNLHNLEFSMPLCRLPARHQVQHMHAFGRLASLLAGLACELNRPCHEQGAVRSRIVH